VWCNNGYVWAGVTIVLVRLKQMQIINNIFTNIHKLWLYSHETITIMQFVLPNTTFYVT